MKAKHKEIKIKAIEADYTFGHFIKKIECETIKIISEGFEIIDISMSHAPHPNYTNLFDYKAIILYG